MPSLLLRQPGEPTPISFKSTLRHALSGITNEANLTTVSPPSTPKINDNSSPPAPISTQTIRDVQLVFDPSPGPFVRIKDLGPGLVIARELEYHWCRGKASARPVSLKIFKKAEVIRQSVVDELLAYKNLVKKDFVGSAFIMRLDGVLEDRESVFFAFDFVQRSLADVLAGLLSDVMLYKVQWVAQIVLGLSAIHTCGIIHRDIKPSNILLDAYNNVRIAGFDSAFMKNTTAVRRNTDPPEHFSSSSSSSSSSSPPPSSLRRHGTSTLVHESTTSADNTPGMPASDENCGTWPYIAPEILSNALKSYKMDKRMYTQAVDYWSLGCLVYELEAGKEVQDNKKYRQFEGLNEHAESLIFGLTRADTAQRFRDADLRRHAYFKDENGQSEFKKWSKYRPPAPKSRPEAYIHVESNDQTSSRINPIIYRPTLDYTEGVRKDPMEVQSSRGDFTLSDDDSFSRNSKENTPTSKASNSSPRSSEASTATEDDWSLGDECWINPRGIWGTSAGRGMPEKNLVLYETRSY